MTPIRVSLKLKNLKGLLNRNYFELENVFKAVDFDPVDNWYDKPSKPIYGKIIIKIFR